MAAQVPRDRARSPDMGTQRVRQGIYQLPGIGRARVA